jgi:hypothetical protein
VFPRRTVWIAIVSEGSVTESGGVQPGIEAHQAQELSRPSDIPAGMAGAAGCREHHTPEQGRGRGSGGTGNGSDGLATPPAGSRTKGAISVGIRPGLVLDVTRCEQPACAAGGASKADARSDMTAAAGRNTRFPKRENLVICQVCST